MENYHQLIQQITANFNTDLQILINQQLASLISPTSYLPRYSSILYRNLKFSSDIISILFQHCFDIDSILMRYQNKVLSFQY